MGDDQSYLEKRMGHKAYGHMRNWGLIAIWLGRVDGFRKVASGGIPKSVFL